MPTSEELYLAYQQQTGRTASAAPSGGSPSVSRGSHTQSNFLGGQFSPSAAGRIDLPMYKAALAQCVNAYPQEEGNVMRRPGTRLIGPTWGGVTASVLAPFQLSQNYSYIVEVSCQGSVPSVRYYTNGHVVTDGSHVQVTAISTGNPCQITLASAVTWLSNQYIRLQVVYAGLPASQTTMWAPLVNREFKITKIDPTHFTLQDALTGANINGAGFTGALPVIYADHITQQALSSWVGLVTNPNQVRAVQAPNTIYLLNANQGAPVQPYAVTVAGEPTSIADATFSVAPVQFIDGPYFGNNSADGPYTASGTSGTITFNSTTATQINGGLGFQSSDVGRVIRLNQISAAWNSGTTYAAGQVISYPGTANSIQYVALVNSGTNLNKQPDTEGTFWAPIANYSIWVWGTIASVVNTITVTVTLNSALNALTNPIVQIALGKYTNFGNAWPSAGAFFEQRAVFGQGQNIDFSTSNGAGTTSIIFSPTDGFGNVLDNSAISEALVGPNIPIIFWLHADGAALIVGCLGSEWVVQASQLGNPLTPTSFQAHPVTKYGSNYELPERPGIALTFINRYSQRIMEYLIDPFSQKYSGKPLNIYAGNITTGLFCLAYSDEPNPILWTLGNQWSGCTYRRVSYFASEMPTFYGWHTHTLGSGHSVQWMDVGYDITGSNDLLYLLTNDGTFGYVEYLTPPIGDSGTLLNANFVDSGFTGIIYNQPYRYEGIYGVSDGNGNIVFNGLYYMAGKSVAVWLAGLDFGNYTVSANGTITVPYASDPGALGTVTYIQSTAVGANTYGGIPISFNDSGHTGNFTIPGVIGFTYNTTLQKLRPDDPESSGMRSGAVGQLKRHHWYALNVVQGVANTVQVGSNPSGTLYNATLANFDTGQPTPTNVIFTGIHRDTIESDEDLDGQMFIQVSRPVPLTLAAITGFMETEEI